MPSRETEIKVSRTIDLDKRCHSVDLLDYYSVLERDYYYTRIQTLCPPGSTFFPARSPLVAAVMTDPKYSSYLQKKGVGVQKLSACCCLLPLLLIHPSCVLPRLE
jgi:hypothetical protein